MYIAVKFYFFLLIQREGTNIGRGVKKVEKPLLKHRRGLIAVAGNKRLTGTGPTRREHDGCLLRGPIPPL